MAGLTVELLSKIPLLHGLDDKLMGELVSLMQIKILDKKAPLMHKGESGEEIFFLLEGRLLVVDVSPEGRQTGLY
jgi:CRP-like cAMP-binding protein